MTDLFEKSMETLELPRVLSLLADQAVTEEGKERARRLRPETDPAEVALRLKETTAAVNKMVLRGSPSFSGVKPVAGSLQRADMGGSLNTRELLDIAGVLAAARSAKEYGESDGEEKSPIDVLFHSLHPNRFLEDKITGSIVGDGELADSASPELASIRRHIRATESKVRDILQKIISSSQAKYLQESIITQRSGRYVVPVKSEFKNEIPGLVHDLSGSGSTFFIEPMGVVKANNELRELQAKEEKEIDRILAELSAEAASFREDITLNYDLLIRLDSIFARGKLSARMGAMEPGLSAKSLCLRRARHPLLPPKTAVANDLSLGEKFDTLVITGPNTGGKTVTLKTIGLLTLMAQCGLHIPAGDGSTIRVCQRVLADMGRAVHCPVLSTFSSHMRTSWDPAGDRRETLVLLTSWGRHRPSGGAALAAPSLRRPEPGALVAATTHYAELKVYAMTTPGWRMPPVSLMWRPWPPPTGCWWAFPASPTPLPSPSVWACPRRSSSRPPPG
ncbi:MAG: endonuclease MutS2 [Evtepia gabavorous]